MSGRIGDSAGVSYGDPRVGRPMERGGDSTAPAPDIATEFGDAIIAELERSNPENAARIGVSDALGGARHLP